MDSDSSLHPPTAFSCPHSVVRVEFSTGTSANLRHTSVVSGCTVDEREQLKGGTCSGWLLAENHFVLSKTWTILSWRTTTTRCLPVHTTAGLYGRMAGFSGSNSFSPLISQTH